MPGSFLTLLIIWHIMNSIHSQPQKIQLEQCQWQMSMSMTKWQLLIYIWLMFYVKMVERYLKIQHYARNQYENNKSMGLRFYMILGNCWTTPFPQYALSRLFAPTSSFAVLWISMIIIYLTDSPFCFGTHQELHYVQKLIINVLHMYRTLCYNHYSSLITACL